MTIKSPSIKRLLLTLLGFMSLSMMGLLGMAARSAHRLIEERAQDQLRESAVLTSADINREIEQTMALLEEVSRQQLLDVRPERCGGFLAHTVSAIPSLANVLVVDKDGQVLCSGVADMFPDSNLIANSEVFAALEQGEPIAMGTPAQALGIEKFVLEAGVPIFDANGAFDGAAIGVMTLDHIQRIVERDARQAGRPDALITLVDKDMHIVARSEGGSLAVGEHLPSQDVDDIERPGGTPLRVQTANEAYNYQRAVDRDGVMRDWIRAEMPGTGWTLYVGVGSQTDSWLTVLGSSRETRMGLIMVLFAGLLGLALYRHLTTSLETLVRAAAGDGAMIPKRAPLVGAPAEITHVAERIETIVAAQHQAEHERDTAEQTWASFAGNAQFGMLLLDESASEILYANRFMLRMLGVEALDALEDRSVASLFLNPKDHARVFEEARGGSTHEVKLLLDGPTDARLLWGSFEAGGSTRISVLIEDITWEKAREKEAFQHQKMEAVGKLVSGVAHDFNNILTIIIAAADASLASLPSGMTRLQHNLEEIENAGKRGERLVKDLSLFSRDDRSEARDLNLGAALTSTIPLMERLTGDDVVIDYTGPDEDVIVRANENRIQQVLLNLTTNARDEMPKGGRISLELSTVSLAKNDERLPAEATAGPYAELRFRDTGGGMDPLTCSRIFEAFFTTKEAGKGTGLGLSTVQAIVTGFNGHILVDSEIGVGTTFTIRLPLLSDVAEGKVDDESPKERNAGLRQGKETVLIVDDEESVVDSVSSVMEEMGYTVIRATDPGIALHLAEKHPAPIDILVVDLKLGPTMQGDEVHERVQKLHPAIQTVFISGSFQPGNDTWVGVTDSVFLGKPCTGRDVVRSVQALIDAKKRRAEEDARRSAAETQDVEQGD